MGWQPADLFGDPVLEYLVPVLAHTSSLTSCQISVASRLLEGAREGIKVPGSDEEGSRAQEFPMGGNIRGNHRRSALSGFYDRQRQSLVV